ncbi:MAG: hypothetical protein QM750_09850 [Rubrivivax sp.]
MSVALQVLLLVVAIVVAVAGLGVALALRLSSRQRLRQRQMHQHQAQKAAARGAVKPAARAAARGAAPARSPAPAPAAVPAAPLDPEQAHKAKLAALQAMLALGDERAEREARSGKVQFADTQPMDDDAASPFAGRGDAAQEISLLNLDRVPAPAPRPAR